MRGPIRSSRNEDRAMKFQRKMRSTTGATLGRWALVWLGIFFLVVLSGCMHPASKSLMATFDKGKAFSEVIQDPEAYINSAVLWGGVIEKAIHGPEGTDLIVRQAPLDSKGYPQIDSSEGEFIAHTLRLLNPEIFLKGMEVTVAGEIDDVAERRTGLVRYPCPMVRVIEIHAWTKNIMVTFPISRGWEFNQYGPSATRNRPIVMHGGETNQSDTIWTNNP